MEGRWLEGIVINNNESKNRLEIKKSKGKTRPEKSETREY